MYILAIKRTGNAITGTDDLKVEFESQGQYTGVENYCQADVDSVSGSATKAIHAVTIMDKNFDTVTITFTVKPTSGNKPVFGIKFNNNLVSGGVQLVCYDDGTDPLTVKKYVGTKTGDDGKLPTELTFEPEPSGTIDSKGNGAPGGGGGGGETDGLEYG